MTNFIPTYLINTSQSFEDWIRKQPFYYKAGIIFLKDPEEFFKVIEERPIGFSFRLLIHPGLSGNASINEDDLLDVETIHNTIRAKPIFDKINIPLITRASFLKKLKEQEPNSIHFKHLGYRFYYAPYCSTEQFIQDIPIITKEINSLTNINQIELSKENNSTPKITILTALTDDEYSSFRENVNEVNEIDGCLEATFKPDDHFKHDYKGTLFFQRQKKMGSVESSITTSRIFNSGTNALIMSGVCGGRKSEVNLYDIIIASEVVDIITGKYEGNIFVPIGYQEPANEGLIEHLSESNRKTEIKNRMLSLIPDNKIRD